MMLGSSVLEKLTPAFRSGLQRFSHFTPATNSFKLTVKKSVHSENVFPALLLNRSFSEIPITGSPISIEQLQKFTETIIAKASEKDVMVTCMPVEQISQDLKTLLEFGLSEKEVSDICMGLGSLKKLSNMKCLIECLVTYGFQPFQAIRIISNLPHLQEISAEVLMNSLKDLHQFGFTVDDVIEIVVNHPVILEKDVATISQRISDLKQRFKTSDTLTLIKTTPDLLFCDFSYIQDRFNYVFHEMGITQRQMMYSKLFTYPMEHIHTRHMFVVRAGYFRKVKSKDMQISNNPTLDTILDLSDDEFVKKFGKMSVTDYHTFKKLLLRENNILKELENEELLANSYK